MDNTWMQWCRLCGMDDPQGNINVFFEDEQMTANLMFSASIRKYFYVDITEDDELPKMLCTKCISLVTSLVNISELTKKVQYMFYALHIANTVNPAVDIDLREVRLKYGLEGSDRDHMLNPSAEFHCNDSNISGLANYPFDKENIENTAHQIKTEPIWMDDYNDEINNINDEEDVSKNRDCFGESELGVKANNIRSNDNGTEEKSELSAEPNNEPPKNRLIQSTNYNVAKDDEAIASEKSKVDYSHKHNVYQSQTTTYLPMVADAARKKQNKKRHNPFTRLRQEYRWAVRILDKIAKNKAAGIFHDKDAEDTLRYQKVVEEYERQSSSNMPFIPATNLKRNRSEDETSSVGKKARLPMKGGLTEASSSGGAYVAKKNKESAASSGEKAGISKRTYREFASSHLNVTLIDEFSKSSKPVLDRWSLIEARLSELVMEHLLNKAQGLPVSFDCSEFLRGFRIIKCEDQASLNFLGECVTKISNAWEGLKIKLIPVREIPRRPRARIWLPKMEVDNEKVLQCLRLQNPEIPMDNWSVLKAEEPLYNNMVLIINEECLEALDRAGHTLRFGIRKAKIKVFRVPPDEDDPEEDAASKLLEDSVA